MLEEWGTQEGEGGAPVLAGWDIEKWGSPGAVGGCLETLGVVVAGNGTVVAAEENLEVEVYGEPEALGRTVSEVVAVGRLGVREMGCTNDSKHTYLVLCLGEDLLASEYHRRYPRVPPQPQEVGLRAWRCRRRNLRKLKVSH